MKRRPEDNSVADLELAGEGLEPFVAAAGDFGLDAEGGAGEESELFVSAAGDFGSDTKGSGTFRHLIRAD